MKKKFFVILALLFPLAFSYHIMDYTGGDVYIAPTREINLVLPFPSGNNCLPVAVLFVEGGKDFPVISVNGKVFVGGGIHRTDLEGNRVVISAKSGAPAIIKGKSLIYCTKDPFVKIKYYPPQPVEAGNYNYATIILENRGYTEGNIRLDIKFHRDLAPFSPPYQTVKVPPRSRVSYTLFLIASPLFKELEAHPEACIEYRDSVMEVEECDGPFPTTTVIRPRIVCLEGICENTSNIIIELNGGLWKPGDTLLEGDLNEIKDSSPQIIEVNLRKENGAQEGKNGFVGPLMVLLGLAIVVIRTAPFKY